MTILLFPKKKQAGVWAEKYLLQLLSETSDIHLTACSYVTTFLYLRESKSCVVKIFMTMCLPANSPFALSSPDYS
jgi:hypothetical protein